MSTWVVAYLVVGWHSEGTRAFVGSAADFLYYIHVVGPAFVKIRFECTERYEHREIRPGALVLALFFFLLFFVRQREPR